MKRTTIREIESFGTFKVCGWIVQKNDETILKDITGEIKIENYEKNTSSHMRIAVTLVVEMQDGLCYIKEYIFINENKLTEKEINEMDAVHYLDFLKKDNLRLLGQMNLDELNTEIFFKNEGFYKLYPPLLFTDINEYTVIMKLTKLQIKRKS